MTIMSVNSICNMEYEIILHSKAKMYISNSLFCIFGHSHACHLWPYGASAPKSYINSVSEKAKII